MKPDREKTKSELLRELESIQSLLDDQDIPMLSEVIDKLSPANHPASGSDCDNDRPLNEKEYAHLRKAYNSIQQEVNRQTTKPDTSAATKAKGVSKEENLELDLGALPGREVTESSTPQSEAASHSAEGGQALAGQQALFTLKSEDGSEDSTASEPTKAPPSQDNSEKISARQTGSSGENPFLPQHIRERLRGNRAGDFPASAYNSSPRAYTRKQLVDELVDSLLPEIEQALRLKLAAMSDEQIQNLLND